MHPHSKILLYWYMVENARLAVESGRGERMLQRQKLIHKWFRVGFRPMSDEDRVREIEAFAADMRKALGQEFPEF